ncbi:TetR/AcrR family transcriptional regulator [Thalassospira mesophila]|uniref:TetR/AcrR family transcriptional regulator n=1 Tax=Thalassospira mesophila TaxID=1293891 RepID=UPI000A1EF053|nr:TetR/AcrR family transcriptional regulator [Thalassospira mesophila]
MPAKKDPRNAAILATLDLACEKRWHQVTLIDIAKRADISLGALYVHFKNRNDILRAFIGQIDQQVLADLDPADFDQPRHDRLIDVIMARFDALAPHRNAIKSILRDGGDMGPADGLRATKSIFAAMRWMLEAAGFETGGLHGSLRVAGMTAIYARCFRLWLNDTSPDYGPTMAMLDRDLVRGGGWDQQVGKGLGVLGNIRNRLCHRRPKTATDGGDDTQQQGSSATAPSPDPRAGVSSSPA